MIYFLQNIQTGTLYQEEIFIKILAKYSDFANIFSFWWIRELSKNTSINEHAIELEKVKQPLYRTIYSLRLVELEILKAYIKTHLRTKFIWLFKSSAAAPIFFNKKPHGSFCLCINYKIRPQYSHNQELILFTLEWKVA